MLLGNLLQQMYNVVDTWVVGNCIGSDALAGVGSAYTLMVFLTSILLGLCMGSGVVFSLCFGQKDEQKLKESVGTAFLLIAAAAVLLTVQGLVNSFGTTIMAAFAAAVKIDSFAYMPAQEYGNAFSTFIAQNMGAGKKERVVKGIQCAALTSITYCAAASFVLWFQAEKLMQIFVSASETVIVEEGVRYLHIEGAFYCGIGCLFLLYGFYRAIGKPAMSFVLTIISLGTRVALAYLLSPVSAIGVAGIWWAIPIGWFLADTVGIVYLIGKRKEILSVDAAEDVKQ